MDITEEASAETVVYGELIEKVDEKPADVEYAEDVNVKHSDVVEYAEANFKDLNVVEYAVDGDNVHSNVVEYAVDEHVKHDMMEYADNDVKHSDVVEFVVVGGVKHSDVVEFVEDGDVKHSDVVEFVEDGDVKHSDVVEFAEDRDVKPSDMVEYTEDVNNKQSDVAEKEIMETEDIDKTLQYLQTEDVKHQENMEVEDTGDDLPVEVQSGSETQSHANINKNLKEIRNQILDDWEGETETDAIDKEDDTITKEEAENKIIPEKAEIFDQEVEVVQENENEEEVIVGEPLDDSYGVIVGNPNFKVVEVDPTPVHDNNEAVHILEIGQIETDKDKSVVKENGQVKDKSSFLKLKKLTFTKQEVMSLIEDSVEKRLDVPKTKDVFLSIELVKNRNKEIAKKEIKEEPATDTNHKDILDILESDEVSDWRPKPVANNDHEKSNDMEILKAVQLGNEATSKKNVKKKTKNIDKEMERRMALQQLREEFSPSAKRVSKKKINTTPFLPPKGVALKNEKSKTPVQLKPATPRRPCYLPPPPEESNNNGLQTEKTKKRKLQSVKTYPVKRKLDSDSANEIKTVLKTIANVTKQLKEEEEAEVVEEEEDDDTEDVKEQNEDSNEPKNIKKKLIKKRKNKELDNLLGDEGAVRMIYETDTTDVKKTKRSTKNLELKAKLVKNAVLKLSQNESPEGGRRTRKSNVKQETEGADVFEQPETTSVSVLQKAKKKQTAEASRILYRHSSSESFDSSPERRQSLDEEKIVEKVVEPPETQDLTHRNTELSQKYDKFLCDETIRELPQKLKKVLNTKMKSKDKRKKVALPRVSTDSQSSVNLSAVRKSSRPRKISKKYAIWASDNMDSLATESLGIRKPKKTPTGTPEKIKQEVLSPNTSTSAVDQDEGIRIVKHGNLVQIFLDTHDTYLKNSFNSELLTELLQVFTALDADDTCSAILLSSSDPHIFCQGVDLQELLQLNNSSKRQLVLALQSFAKCLLKCKKTIIVGVNGSAVGFGVTLLPYCDVVMSSEYSTFYTPYVALGQVSEAAATYTFPHISHSLVSDLIFRCQKLNADEAFSLGLVHQTIPGDNFDEEMLALATKVSGYSSQAIQAIKSLKRLNVEDKIEELLELEGPILLQHWSSTECLNNITKFLESEEVTLNDT